MTQKLKLARISPLCRRVTGPSCRGGASSLLRLSRADSMRLPSVGNLSGWVQRAAAMLSASAQSTQPTFSGSEYGVGSSA